MNRPTLIGEITSDRASAETRLIRVRGWIRKAGLPIPDDLLPAFAWCDSAAELLFLWEFAKGGDVLWASDRMVYSEQLRVESQAAVGKYRVDAVVTRTGDPSEPPFRLGIEIDGMGFHHRTPEQVADDYVRQRRLVLCGLTVVRFTVHDVFKDAAECWRQIDAIMDRRAPAELAEAAHG